MTRLRPYTLGLLLLASALAPAALAEDIDIFAGTANNNDLPNVLIVWDNSANWSASISVPNCYYTSNGTLTDSGPKASNPGREQGAKMAIEKCAIHNVIDSLPVAADGGALFNVGLMLFNESPASNSGGYPRAQFVPLTNANKTALMNAIKKIAIGDDKGNNAAFSKTLYEAYLMFKRAKPYRGTAGTKWDPAAVVNGAYVGPPGSGCGTNHIIFVANGGPGENTDAEARDLLAAAGGNVAPLVYPSSLITNSDQANWADEYARFLRHVDVSPMDGVQSITTHGIAVTGASSDGLYPNFIRAMANQGGGQYYSASNIGDLVKALTNIFNAIQAVNSVFASASLPISVNTQGTYKNQVFVGVFRPDEAARPRWLGNLKQYQMAYDRATDSLALVDRDGYAALNAATGFFNPSAVSFWTTPSTFWSNDPKGTPPSVSDQPDGEVVEKGAVAEGLRKQYATSQTARRVYTCVGCAAGTVLSAESSTRFEYANSLITASMLGAADSLERTAIIQWVRGNDNKGDELGPGGDTTVRPSIHGDVLHSRPAVVDFGAGYGTIVFYGSNDGTLRAIDGNQSGASAGQELWAFVPSEFFPRLKRLRDDQPAIRFPTTPAGASATPRDYFIDGSLTLYQKLASDGTSAQAIIYVSMRRGGRYLYALDVTTPTAPVMLWRKSYYHIENLGQTWSEPRVARVKGYLNPVLVLGAGYDAAAEDASSPGATTMGNAVLVVDALTGALVKSLPTYRSVAAAVATVDTDYDGYTDRLYAVDAGANVYRVDLETAGGATSPASWAITRFAALGDSFNSRKFLHAPDVVLAKTFAAILVGSGNRERPLLASTNDRFYTLLDYHTAKGAPAAPPLTDEQLVAQGAPISFGSTAGCYLALNPAGEKVVNSAASIGGYTYFSTNRPTPPAPNTCAANLGLATTYRLPLFCGAAESIQLAGGGLPPSPVVGEVEITLPPGADGAAGGTVTEPFVIGGFNPALSGLAVSKVPIVVDPTRRRLYWYINTTH